MLAFSALRVVQALMMVPRCVASVVLSLVNVAKVQVLPLAFALAPYLALQGGEFMCQNG